MHKTYSSFVKILAVLLFSGCIAKNLTFKNGKDWIPQDFDAKNSTLMVEVSFSGLTSEEKSMAEYVKEKYPYGCAFVILSDITNKTGPFSDLNKYRFVLRNTSGFIERADITKPAAAVQDFYFYDRLKDKSYPPTKRGSYKKIITFKPLINTLVESFKK
jgi:hypothetical protein